MIVSHDRRGAGAPLVLVHGIGSRWQVFEPVIDALAERHDVIAVDLPGFGASPLPDGFIPSPQRYAGWLTAWLRDLGVERPHVVGNSMGGGIALEMARAGAAGRATAFSPIGFWTRVGAAWCQAMVSGIRGVGKVGGAPLSRALGTRPVRIAAASGFYGRPQQLTAEYLRADLAGIVGGAGFPLARTSFGGYSAPVHLPEATPVTVAWGTRDVLLTHRTQSRRARAALPGARHVDLPGCGHVPFSDDPAQCARVILQEAP